MNKKRKLAAWSSVGAAVCVPALVDRAGVAVEQHARLRLIAALLGRPHLILSGSDTILLNALVRALATSWLKNARSMCAGCPVIDSGRPAPNAWATSRR
jgi:hypothetical protein